MGGGSGSRMRIEEVRLNSGRKGGKGGGCVDARLPMGTNRRRSGMTQKAIGGRENVWMSYSSAA